MIEEILANISKREGMKVTVDDLTESERDSLLDYERALSDKEITLEDVRKFISRQLRSVETQLLTYENTREKDLYLKAIMRNMKMIKAFITNDDVQKKALVAEIEKAHGITLTGKDNAPKKDVAKEKKSD